MVKTYIVTPSSNVWTKILKTKLKTDFCLIKIIGDPFFTVYKQIMTGDNASYSGKRGQAIFR